MRNTNKKPIQRFFTNVICGFVYNKDKRKKIRVILNSPMREYVNFIRRDTGLRRPRMRTFVGYQARSLVIGVDNKWVYKFPLRRDNYKELARREQRIVQILKPVSPIYTPDVELLECGDVLVRKYEFIRGATLRSAPPEIIIKNIPTLARQVAQFVYDIAIQDPDALRDLKPTPDAKPGYMYGWCQGDICDNFIIDLDTMQVRAIIDWEDASFHDFSYLFRAEKRSPAREFMTAVGAEYDKIWHANNKSA